MRVRLLNGINALKTKDNATEIKLEVLDENLSVVDLSTYQEITVNIGKDRIKYQTITPQLYNDNKALSFTVDGNLPSGKHVIEINLVNSDGTIHIAPSHSKLILTVEHSLTEMGTQIPLYSVQELLDKMDQVIDMSIVSDNKSTDALNKANLSLEQSTESLSLSQESNQIAHDVEERTVIAEEKVADVISKTSDRVMMFYTKYPNLGSDNTYGRFPFNGEIVSVRGTLSTPGEKTFTEVDIEKSTDMNEWNSIFDNSFLTFNIGDNFDNGNHVINDKIINPDDFFRLTIRTLSNDAMGLLIEIKVKLY